MNFLSHPWRSLSGGSGAGGSYARGPRNPGAQDTRRQINLRLWQTASRRLL